MGMTLDYYFYGMDSPEGCKVFESVFAHIFSKINPIPGVTYASLDKMQKYIEGKNTYDTTDIITSLKELDGLDNFQIMTIMRFVEEYKTRRDLVLGKK